MTDPKKPQLRILLPASIVLTCGMGAVLTAINGECTWQIVYTLGGVWFFVGGITVVISELKASL